MGPSRPPRTDSIRASTIPDHGPVKAGTLPPTCTLHVATPAAVGQIHSREMTLARKAKLFEAAIDKHHRRTPYGYVLGVRLRSPGLRDDPIQHDSDNDGLWTAMYGAGECFAYGATKNPTARKRARAASRNSATSGCVQPKQ